MSSSRHHRRLVAAAILSTAMLAGCHGSVAPAALDAGRADVSAPPAPAAPDATVIVSPDAGVDLPVAPPSDASAAADSAVSPTDVGTAPGAWARGVQLSLVEISQAVFIKLGDDKGVVPTAMRNSKLLPGRAAYVRAHVRPDLPFTARPLRAVLTLGQSGGSEQSFPVMQMVSGPSTPEKLDSTFNFLLPAEQIEPGSTLAVALYEAGAATGPEPATPPRFPATGTLDLAVQPGPLLMDIALVTVRGPSGPLDDSPARRQHLERYMADVYPAAKMTIHWEAPLTVTGVTSTAALFKLVGQARRRDNASPGTYYHMLLAVEEAQDKFLGIGTLAGPLPGDGADRVAMTMVTGHQVDSQLDTIAHEMGHNLGRNHAPGCNAAGADMRYPYANTGVGVDGFSLGELAAGKDHLPNAPGPFKPRAKFKDVMGYCYPTWISDYTWNAFMDRIRIVSEFTTPGVTLEQRSLQGFHDRGHAPAWLVVSGALVPPTAPLDPRRFARIELADGSQLTAPVSVSELLSPAGPESDHRRIAVTLPDGEVTRVELFVDGERFTAAGPDLADQ
jgi:hypothetical protein